MWEAATTFEEYTTCRLFEGQQWSGECLVMITLTESLKQNSVFGKLKCLISNNIIKHINQIILIYLVIMFDWSPGLTESYFQLCRKTKQGNEAGKSRGYRVGTSLSVVITRISYLIWRPLNQKKDTFFKILQFYTQFSVAPATQILPSGNLRAEVPLLYGF